MKKEHYNANLFVEYTDKEMVSTSKEIAKESRKLRKMEEERKKVTTELKTKCDQQQEYLDKLLEKIEKGGERKPVQCEAQYNEEGKLIKTIRTDTGKEIKDTHQTEMNLKKKKNKEKKK